MKAGIQIKSGGSELLPAIESLWKELCEHHFDLEKRFPNSAPPDFESRLRTLKYKGKNHQVELVRTAEDSDFIGYCVSTIDNSLVGEIDSLYIDRNHRRHGIGKELVKRALCWMDEHHVSEKRVCVLAANKTAVDLYKKFGFAIRQYEMIIPSEKLRVTP